MAWYRNNASPKRLLGALQMEFGTRPEDVVAASVRGLGVAATKWGHEVIKEFAAKFPTHAIGSTAPFDLLENGDADSNWLPWLTMRPPGHAPPAPTARLELIEANRAILAGRRRSAVTNLISRFVHGMPEGSFLQLPPRAQHRPHDCCDRN